ncbi:N-acetyl-D-Glu racemase DgcA [Chelativorans composti]|jgi:L-alanine-DL-glutamate epimerase and related enzymes of enolase superfamily|uniref:Dipeptide epimerase n=1 Tax=Chelativorans composti TaxID=768533 RepID=A0ABW5DGZ3_9HYPH|nr:dipeptide epimerase [bacterium SGD-2]
MTRRTLTAGLERFPIAGTFRIARGARTEAAVVVCTVSEGPFSGKGECVPYPRYGETVESVIAQIESLSDGIAGGMTREELLETFPAGAARNAVDCALWDLEAKKAGRRVHELAGLAAPQPLVTTQTISLATPEEMEQQARLHSSRPVLKFKVGMPDGDAERIEAVRRGAPNSQLILDANEGWTEDNIEDNLRIAEKFGVALIEQPLPAGKDAILREVARTIPLCADESLHTREDLPKLAGLYDAVNIKLDKTGGLTEALLLKAEAERMGFSIMVGCMVGTSLAMAPAILAAQGAQFVDLDGPLLLARDREPGLVYEGAKVYPPAPKLWG